MQSQWAGTHLTGVPNFGVETYGTAMQVVGTVVECQLIFFTVQDELSFTDAVTPTTNECWQVLLLATRQLLDAAVSLNDVCHFAILVRNHDSTDSATVVRDSYFVTFTVLQDVKVRFLTIDSGLEVFALQTTEIRIFNCVCHINSL